MKYKVYHAINPTFGFGKQPEFPNEYELVAEVECDGVEDVFRITNHIDTNWTGNPEVIEVYKTNGCRSTSVGDMAVDQNGKAFYCDMVGWKDVEGNGERLEY